LVDVEVVLAGHGGGLPKLVFECPVFRAQCAAAVLFGVVFVQLLAEIGGALAGFFIDGGSGLAFGKLFIRRWLWVPGGLVERCA
jgi:hypothetical protein